MFGGIAAARADRLVYATYDGNVLTYDTESGLVVDQFGLYPAGPKQTHVSACALAADGSILLADVRHHRVRRFSPDGRQTLRYGAGANPGLSQHDEAGVLEEPCALLLLGDDLVVCCGGYAIVHGVQRFDAGGQYVASFPHEADGAGTWRRPQGITLLEDSIWIAETEGGTIRRHARDGRPKGAVELHPDLSRPFRVAADGYGGVFLIVAPEAEEQQTELGVARLDSDGRFQEWAVKAGEDAGETYCPFDVTTLSDGRFAVADLPLGSPPDVRIQIFRADGSLERVLCEDAFDVNRQLSDYFRSLLERKAETAQEHYVQARVHHFHAGNEEKHLQLARTLYEGALERDPAHLLSRLALGGLLEDSLDLPSEAEHQYRAAIEAGGERADLLVRIASCRRRSGDLDGAIEILSAALDLPEPPEDYHEKVEALGDYYLERAGEASGGVQ